MRNILHCEIIDAVLEQFELFFKHATCLVVYLSTTRYMPAHRHVIVASC